MQFTLALYINAKNAEKGSCISVIGSTNVHMKRNGQHAAMKSKSQNDLWQKSHPKCSRYSNFLKITKVFELAHCTRSDCSMNMAMTSSMGKFTSLACNISISSFLTFVIFFALIGFSQPIQKTATL